MKRFKFGRVSIKMPDFISIENYKPRDKATKEFLMYPLIEMLGILNINRPLT